MLRRSLRAERKKRRNVSACDWKGDEGEAQGEAERVRLRRGKPMRSRFGLRIGGSFTSANMLRRPLRAERKERRNVSACDGKGDEGGAQGKAERVRLRWESR
jgi:hypothetical protein